MSPLVLPDPPLSDGVIALRRWSAADVPAIVEACQDPEIPRWTLVPSRLQAIDWDRCAADLGYWVAAPARGRGVATRAVELLAGWAFGALGLDRLELRTNAGNTASQAVARCAGFAPTDGPLVRRPECDHMPDIFFARVRGG